MQAHDFTFPRSTGRAARRFARKALLALLSLAVALPACGDDEAQEEAAADERDFTGVWIATPAGTSARLEVAVEGSRATIVGFGSFHIGNPQVLNAGDPYLTDLTRVAPNLWTARAANIVFEASPTYPRDWPASVEPVDVELAWDGARWRSTGGVAVELTPKSGTFSGTYDSAGACEKQFANGGGATIYACDYPQTSDTCASAGEKRFWPDATCEQLGYEFKSSDLAGQWYDSASSNVTPGPHGQWGDGTGGRPETDPGLGAGGAGGAAPTVVWKDTWLFAQGDKAVMYRLALVAKDGPEHTFRVQYTVNRGDGIYCDECSGYHVFGALQDLSREWRIHFPSGFGVDRPPAGPAASGQDVYELEGDLAVELRPDLAWDEANARVISSQGGVYSLIAHCADDNSDGSRCSAYTPDAVEPYQARSAP